MNRRLQRWLQHQTVSLLISVLIITVLQFARDSSGPRPEDDELRCILESDRSGSSGGVELDDPRLRPSNPTSTTKTTTRPKLRHEYSTRKSEKFGNNPDIWPQPGKHQPTHQQQQQQQQLLNESQIREQRQSFNREHPSIDVDTDRPVVNPFPFTYTINNPGLCRSADGRRPLRLFLVNYVHTAVTHFSRRKRIRQTWARTENYGPGDGDGVMRTVFFVGRDPTGTKWHQHALEYEARKYGDVVQADFLDTYRNLSYKGAVALQWITTYCNQSAYVMKTDDDVFVNMFALLKHLRDIHAEHYRTRLILCLVWWTGHVQRDGQWAIPVEAYPDDVYPIYCSGMGWVFTSDVAAAVHRVFAYVPFLWVDDAYISGVLPKALGEGVVEHADMGQAYCAAHEMGLYYHDTEWYKYVFTHVHDEVRYRDTWDRLLEMVGNRTMPTLAVVRPGVLAPSYEPKTVLFPEPKPPKRRKR